ncbi:MAG: hypothetical protein QNJ17_05470 [Desulfocapsaceae bacterium]|nr:hypothetical protein [Desulfocapsaceae bacterium]
MKILKRLAFVAFIFILGIGVGSLTTRSALMKRFQIFQRGPTEQDLNMLVNRFDRKLQLTDDQEAEVTVILSEGMRRIVALKKTHNPQVFAIINESNNRIKEILNDEQLPKFEDIIQKRMKKLPFKPPKDT